MTLVIRLRVKNETARDFETLSIYSSPGRKIMKSIILAAAVISGLLFSATEASALVCASGPHRAGCIAGGGVYGRGGYGRGYGGTYYNRSVAVGRVGGYGRVGGFRRVGGYGRVGGFGGVGRVGGIGRAGGFRR